MTAVLILATVLFVAGLLWLRSTIRKGREWEEATWPARYQAWREGRGQIHCNDVIANRITLDELIPQKKL